LVLPAGLETLAAVQIYGMAALRTGGVMSVIVAAAACAVLFSAILAHEIAIHSLVNNIMSYYVQNTWRERKQPLNA
jgi:hypothetical protein